MNLDISQIDFEKMNGLVPAVIQDSETKKVLMLGYMNVQALEKTLADKKVTFYSRSKQRLWQKGETSGNFLVVKDIKIDCDNDSLLISAKPQGPTCHTGAVSCFKDTGFSLADLFQLIQTRQQEMPETSYTANLFTMGLEAILDKVAEESAEVLQAARGEGQQRLTEEACDLLYHLFVLLNQQQITLEQIEEELKRRNS